MKHNKSRGMAAITLIVAVILASILIFIVVNYYSSSGQGEGGIKSPIDRAKNVTCLAQRHNIEVALRYYDAQEFKFPSSLSELKDYSSDFTDESFRCPVTGNAYIYDPQTGKVTCPDHR